MSASSLDLRILLTPTLVFTVPSSRIRQHVDEGRTSLRVKETVGDRLHAAPSLQSAKLIWPSPHSLVLAPHRRALATQSVCVLSSAPPPCSALTGGAILDAGTFVCAGTLRSPRRHRSPSPPTRAPTVLCTSILCLCTHPPVRIRSRSPPPRTCLCAEAPAPLSPRACYTSYVCLPACEGVVPAVAGEMMQSRTHYRRAAVDTPPSKVSRSSVHFLPAPDQDVVAERYEGVDEHEAQAQREADMRGWRTHGGCRCRCGWRRVVDVEEEEGKEEWGPAVEDAYPGWMPMPRMRRRTRAVGEALAVDDGALPSGVPVGGVDVNEQYTQVRAQDPPSPPRPRAQSVQFCASSPFPVNRAVDVDLDGDVDLESKAQPPPLIPFSARAGRAGGKAARIRAGVGCGLYSGSGRRVCALGLLLFVAEGEKRTLYISHAILPYWSEFGAL
ncbi:hypothetical protein C8R44DRAFT_895145 [Mycena epipterygia]|nr:hypothetical protein C8R44DRAFT_895145 [Mycena epipterygia]